MNPSPGSGGRLALNRHKQHHTSASNHHPNMKFKTLGLALLSQGAAAQQMIRFGCSQLMGIQNATLVRGQGV